MSRYRTLGMMKEALLAHPHRYWGVTSPKRKRGEELHRTARGTFRDGEPRPERQRFVVLTPSLACASGL